MLAKYRWIITKDHFAEEGADPKTNLNAVGMNGPRYCDESIPVPYAFRMYDDDKTLIYEGFCSEIEFYPLDDFGTPNFGCTYIEYLINGKWEML